MKFNEIRIYSFSTNYEIPFTAYITDFKDSFKANWKKEEIFGRMDPISTYKNTARNIILAFDIPNVGVETAKNNLRKIDLLIQSMYPVYDDWSNGNSILSSPPMFRVRFANMIRNFVIDDDDASLKSGLLCYMENFDFNPKIDSGFFIDEKNGEIYPKLISVNLNLQIVHEHPLGNKKIGDSVFPRIRWGSFPRTYEAEPKPDDPPAPPPPDPEPTAGSQPEQVKEDTPPAGGTPTVPTAPTPAPPSDTTSGISTAGASNVLEGAPPVYKTQELIDLVSSPQMSFSPEAASSGLSFPLLDQVNFRSLPKRDSSDASDNFTPGPQKQ